MQSVAQIAVQSWLQESDARQFPTVLTVAIEARAHALTAAELNHKIVLIFFKNVDLVGSHHGSRHVGFFISYRTSMPLRMVN